ncbi:class I SAM-dependent methyltransferase [bacterium]|nr:class I SAM-dependent methyltransferase [bacterium]NUN46157.1 class I SAM-dependent methyltransferase [bacterium]
MNDKLYYDTISVDQYENRKNRNVFEKYLYDHWHPILVEHIRSFCDKRNVLDLGCGSGAYLGFALESANRVLGLEVSQNMLNVAKRRYPKADFILGDAQKTGIENESLEVIYSVGLLEYVDVENVLKECHRILKKNGHLLILTPNKYGGRKYITRYLKRKKKSSARYYSRKEIVAALEKQGFNVDRIIMNDGLVYLPKVIPDIVSSMIFRVIEVIFKMFSYNPFSQNMIFIATKR